ncbi:hypothetical protein ICN41_09960 [Polynucleobacter sp. 15G-AUS-farblos]|uniref:hypothetical protein n=1 Tax=Polynucleobacter sp. 15G-AUS-farblos TaxID=2689094 RepID=UPI001C0DABFC|nr:hypothetical protein [Polynucleobacter sp. 15G-AUS-farblos]MBU3584313.1 hypothetical protein [Polynucleobacter sp. 15G-AUS-farblos]
MNNSNSQQQVLYPVSFVSYIAIEALFLAVLGILCFYVDQQKDYRNDYGILSAIIFAGFFCRGITIYLLTTIVSKNLALSLLTPLVELIFVIFLFTHPVEVFKHLQTFAGYFLILTGVLRLYDAYWMKIQGVISFCCATGLLLIANGILILLDWPSAGLWSPWIVIGVELITLSALHFWFVFFVRSNIDLGTSKA